MRKLYKALSIAITAAGLTGLAACNNVETSTPTSEVESQTTPTSSTIDYNALIEEKGVNALKFERTLTGKTLQNGGVEKATLSRTTDGDTSTFRLESGRSITVRYLGIDTPESTAGYDKWGKAASVWNASILNSAKEFIIESNSTTIEYDTNGTRVLAFVWYRTSETSEWINLNLQTVLEGYTAYTGTETNVRKNYHNVFYAANEYARSQSKKIWGNEEDIYYPETVTEVTLKDLNDNYDSYYNSKTHVPTRVGFDAYIVDRTVSSNFVTVTVAQNIDGEIYTISISVGYSGNALTALFVDSDLQGGTYYHICGFTDSGKTLHGLTAASFALKDETTTYRIRKNYVNSVSNLTINNITEDGNNLVFTCTVSSSKEYVITVVNASANVKALKVGDKLGGTIYLNEDKTTYTTYSQQLSI